jgi:hypothetical protein
MERPNKRFLAFSYFPHLDKASIGLGIDGQVKTSVI